MQDYFFFFDISFHPSASVCLYNPDRLYTHFPTILGGATFFFIQN